MKKQIKKRNWLLICILVSLAMVLSSGCKKQKQVEPASVEGALAYLESNYGKDYYEIEFLKENHVEPYREALFCIDGSCIYGTLRHELRPAIWAIRLNLTCTFLCFTVPTARPPAPIVQR